MLQDLGLSGPQNPNYSFNFTICHEGYYPFRENINWPPFCFDDPVSFSPIKREWSKYKYNAQDTKEIFSRSPSLVVDSVEDLPSVVKDSLPTPDAPDPPPPVVEENDEVESAVEKANSLEAKKSNPVSLPFKAPESVKLKDFWMQKLAENPYSSPSPPIISSR